LSRQLFDPAVTSHADVDRLLRTEPQVQLTNPPVLNNHSNDFKSHCTAPFPACGAQVAKGCCPTEGETGPDTILREHERWTMLDLPQTTIDKEFSSSDVAAVIRGKEQDRLRDLIRMAGSADWDCLR
jgi:hypothetical protein